MVGEQQMGLLVREVDGQFLILDRSSDTIHQLNSSASIIWQMHDRGETANAMVNELATMFDVDLATASRDVEQTLKTLECLGLMKTSTRVTHSPLST